MDNKISQIIAELCENGINAVYGFRHDKANRPVNCSSVYVYPEKLEAGRLFIAIDVYSPFNEDLSGCMRLAENTSKVVSSFIDVQELSIARLAYDRNSMGYVTRITCSTVYEEAGGISVRFSGFKGKDELFINAEVFDIQLETEFLPYPIFTVFENTPADIVYDSVRYTVTLKGVRGGLGNVLSSYGIFDMSIYRGDGEFVLHKCYVKKSDEPFGCLLTIVGYLQEE